MPPIKVLYMVWKLNTGGAERMAVNYHNHFKNRCDDIMVKTLSFSRPCGGVIENEIDGADSSVEYIPAFWGDAFPAPFRKWASFLFRTRFRKKWFLDKVDEFSPDIIHIHLANLAAEFGDACKQLPKSIKIVYHLHSMPETIGRKARERIKNAIASHLYHPLCVTAQQRDSAVKYYHIPADTPVIYNGINTRKFTECNLSASEILHHKDEMGIDRDAFVVGTVGRGAPIKNYPLLAKASAIIAKMRKTTLLIAGDIPTELKKTIMKEAKTAKVVFAGQTSAPEVIYRLMDVFVLASFYESSSIVAVEAQLSHVPCVISDKVSAEAIISNGVTQVSPQDSPEQWARGILQIAGKESSLRNEDKFDFTKSAQELKDFYWSLVNNA